MRNLIIVAGIMAAIIFFWSKPSDGGSNGRKVAQIEAPATLFAPPRARH